MMAASLLGPFGIGECRLFVDFMEPFANEPGSRAAFVAAQPPRLPVDFGARAPFGPSGPWALGVHAQGERLGVRVGAELPARKPFALDADLEGSRLAQRAD